MFRVRMECIAGESRWVFRIGWGFRILCAITFLGLLGASVLAGSVQTGVWLAVLPLVGALYEERLVLDRETGRCEQRWGLVFFFRARRRLLSEVSEVRLVESGPARFVRLELGWKDGSVTTVESDRGKVAAERMTQWAKDLASWLGVALKS